jgi:hypothetical protein
MSRQRWILLVLVFFLVVGLLLWQRASAQTGQPGTAEDPIVTRSYVEQFLVVELRAGGSIVGQAGTQFLLRAGSAYCLADPSTTKGGLSDVTGGIDVRHMESVRTNHLLICPRSDGRGLLAQTDIVLLVWGLAQEIGN